MTSSVSMCDTSFESPLLAAHGSLQRRIGGEECPRSSLAVTRHLASRQSNNGTWTCDLYSTLYRESVRN